MLHQVLVHSNTAAVVRAVLVYNIGIYIYIYTNEDQVNSQPA